MKLKNIKTKEQLDAAVQEAREKKLPTSLLVKLKCLDCSAYEIAEVKRCPVTMCPLWSKRGYYLSTINDETDTDTEEAVLDA